MTDPWPFSELEWSRVGEAARPIVNATFAEDPILANSHREELFRVLEELREKHGEHPVLLETEADFTDDARHRLELYRKAVKAALDADMPTFTIRVSIAELLVEEFGDRKQAREELLACESELKLQTDKSDREQWNELMEECCLESESGT